MQTRSSRPSSGRISSETRLNYIPNRFPIQVRNSGDKSKVCDSNDVLLVRASSSRPKAGTWYLKRFKKLLFSSSSSHLECNSFSTRLQQRKPGAGSSRRYFFAVWLRKRSERYRSWTAEAKLRRKVLLSLPSTCLLLAVTGDASNHAKRPRKHNLRT